MPRGHYKLAVTMVTIVMAFARLVLKIRDAHNLAMAMVIA